MSTLQYLREASIVIGSAGGQALDFSDFRCVFEIHRGDYQNPNTCDLRIYNVSDSTANRIKNEFTQVSIKVGYSGTLGQIFTGTIRQFRRGREDAKNTYVDVTASDGDEAYNFSTLALSLRAGTTPQNAIQQIIKAMAGGSTSQPISTGYLPTLPSNSLPRGRVYFGLARDELRDFANSNECSWSIQDGQVSLVPLTSYIPATVPVISSLTGLLGIPEQTQQGIRMRVLLNPAMKIGQCVKLDNKDTINLYRYSLDINAQAYNLTQEGAIKTNADGLYYVMIANHRGDTRGDTWETEMTCLAVDATVPLNIAPFAPVNKSAQSIQKFG